MTGKNIVGIVFSNSYDECLPELTGLRTMGSVPFAGRYRFIDFTLSNMVNAGIENVGVGCPSELDVKFNPLTYSPDFDKKQI